MIGFKLEPLLLGVECNAPPSANLSPTLLAGLRSRARTRAISVYRPNAKLRSLA